MRPEPLWLYTLRTSIGLQTILLFIAVPVVTYVAVLMLDAAAGVDANGVQLACARTWESK